ncbi:MAG: hypothetical protein BGO70_06745 [Bacteroidetes bacterium 43-93]|nr:T9SS type A sorting domain-containing protein [Bacteroidota bacterium]OJW97479.1 MAG: hypothetical protein BGO70_06745 [Bacteroidetes bacterium 43-93]
MKQLYTIFHILFLLIYSLSVSAQVNMVANGNFEVYNTCPNNGDQVYRCTGWQAYHSGSSDYFNRCTNSSVGVPVNAWGYREPASGDAYTGLYIGRLQDATDYKEYITTKVMPLQENRAYEVSMSVSLADISQYAAKGLGVWFYKDVPLFTGMAGLPVVPQLIYDTLVTQKSGWVRLKKVIVADSSYDHMVIGGFIPSAMLDTVGVNSGNQDWIYYFIDSVVVRKVSHINMQDAGGAYCLGDTVIVPFDVYGNNYFQPGNAFILQLSSSTGSFKNPVNVDTIYSNTGDTFRYAIPGGIVPGSNYLVRIIGTDSTDTSDVSSPLVIGDKLPSPPIAFSNSPLCTGALLELYATDSTPGVYFTWEGPRGFRDTGASAVITIATSADSGPYIVTAWRYGCAASDTTIVNIAHVIGSAASTAGSPVCTNDTLRLRGSAVGNPKSYSWTGPGGFTAHVADTFIVHPAIAASGNYTLTVAFNGCSASDSVAVAVKQGPIDVFASANNPLCSGDTMVLRGYASGGNLSYTWQGPNGYSVASAIAFRDNITPALNGSYILTAGLNGCYVKDTLDIIVNDHPGKPVANVNGPLLVGDIMLLSVASPITDVSYSWTGPSGFAAATASAAINAITRENQGTYIVTASQYGCSSSDTLVVTIGGNNDPYLLQVYPNPSNGNFTVYANTKYDQDVAMSLSTSGGQIVYRSTASVTGKILRANVNMSGALSSGVYTLRARIDGIVQDVGVVIQR